MADEPIEETEEVETTDEVAEEQQDDEKQPFEGEYDPQRARKLIDKLRDENAELKKQKDTTDDPEKARLEVENLQLKVALELGIPAKLATRLRGTTREELIEDAADLMDTVAPRKEEIKSQQPRPRLKGGTRPDAEPEMSADDIVKAAKRR